MAELDGGLLYCCSNCRNAVALRSYLLSKDYLAKSGPAFMFSHAMNIVVGHKEDKKLLTGLFSVADVYCSNCGEVLGWMYVRAYEATQKFKEGNFILETSKIAKEYELDGRRFYSCSDCRKAVALRADLVSKDVVLGSGPGIMLSQAMNIVVGPKEDRKLLAGVDTAIFSVADVYCSNCCEVLGWKFVRAYDATHKFNEGKFILETAKIVKEDC